MGCMTSLIRPAVLGQSARLWRGRLFLFSMLVGAWSVGGWVGGGWVGVLVDEFVGGWVGGSVGTWVSALVPVGVFPVIFCV